MTALHLSAYSIVKFLTVQRYILCIYLANFLPIFFLREGEIRGIRGVNGILESLGELEIFAKFFNLSKNTSVLKVRTR